MKGLSRALLIVSVSIFALAGTLPATAQDGARKEKIIMVSGPLFLGFFSALKLGADQAAKDLGIDFQYVTVSGPDNPGPDTARLLQVAATQNPDAIATGDFFPDAQDPVLRDILAKGIPLVIHNSGRAFAEENDITFLGNDPTQDGLGLGKRQASEGVKHGLCVIHAAGPNLEETCRAYAEALTAAGAKATNLNVTLTDATNPNAFVQAVIGALRADSTIDGIVALDSQQGIQVAQAVEEAGLSGKVNVGTLVVSTGALNLVKDGKLNFVVDVQPYLQGYYSVLVATQIVRYGMRPLGMISTAPLFVDQSNVDQVLKMNAETQGARGPE
jgi:simple sugar transport system substrate-binding protein